MLARLARELFAPPPLNDFADYDVYWTKRDAGGDAAISDPRSEAVEPYIPKGATVLDVGCGAGNFLALLKATRSDCTTFGLDISAKAVEICRRRGINCEVLDTTKPIAAQVPGKYDVVTLMEVMEHVADAEGLFAQARELARQRVIVTIPNAGFFLNRLRLLFGRWPVTVVLYHMREHLRFWTVSDFRQWAKYMGMEVKAIKAQNPNWLCRLWPGMVARQLVYVLEFPHP